MIPASSNPDWATKLENQQKQALYYLYLPEYGFYITSFLPGLLAPAGDCPDEPR